MQARACIRFVPTFHSYGSGGKGASLQLEAQHVNHVLPNVAAFLAYPPTAPWESDAGKSLHSLRTNLSLLRQRRKRSITAAGGTTCKSCFAERCSLSCLPTHRSLGERCRQEPAFASYQPFTPTAAEEKEHHCSWRHNMPMLPKPIPSHPSSKDHKKLS